MSGALVEVPDFVWTAVADFLSRDALATLGDRVSSCEIKTSARGVDLSVKVYAGSDSFEAVDEAMQQYLRAWDQLRDALTERGVKVA